MLDLYLLLDSIIVVAFLFVGFVVLVKDVHPLLNKLFIAFVVSAAGWIIANYYSNNLAITHGLALFANHLTLLLPGLALASLLNFALVISGRNPFSPRWAMFSFLSVLIYLLSLTSWVVGDISVQGNVYAIKFGALASLYFVFLLLTMVTVVLVLLSGMRNARDNQTRRRLKVIFWGLTVLLATNILTNALLPAVNNLFALTNLGPVSSAAMVYALWYSIVKHRLFDIRLVIARSLGYVTSIAMLAGIYGIVVFGIANFVFNLSIPFTAQVSLAAATGFSGLIFPYMKKRFDRLTNTLFYRDAYAPEELFRQLNTMLVSSLDMRYLMIQSVTIIETTLKAEFALVGLRGEGDKHRIFTKHKINFSPEDIALVRQVTPQLHHQKVIVADYLDDPKLSKLQELMRRNNVGVIVRLTQNTRSREDSLGYLILGNKKSGNPYTQQDIRVLDTVANELIIAIQNALHYEEIQQFNLVLQGRVDEATRKFRRTNEKLKALDETKDDFISMASHQLRTPLTSVKGYLSMVLEGDAGKLNATQHKMLQQAFTSSQRMVYLIADLLNVSRLRTGKFIIEQAPTNLAVMIEEEIAQLVEAAKVKDIELTYNKPKDFPELLLDETKTRQVIMNLVDNAIYYTPTGGHIKVQLAATDKSVELQVIDDGIGVPKSEQHHLFTKFYRAGNARKARPDGTGLGLFMAKKVVLAQGGGIIFESKENVGSTFGFSFPRTKLAVSPQPAPVASLVMAAPPEKPKP